jgi:integrase
MIGAAVAPAAITDRENSIMPKVKLTQTLIDNPTTKPDIYRDSVLPGLVLRRFDSGKITYSVDFKDHRNKRQTKKIADGRHITLTQARDRAKELLAAIAVGQNPFDEQRHKSSIRRFQEFVASDYLPYIKARKRSYTTDESHLRNHIYPVIGRLYLDDITHREINRLVESSRRKGHAPATINRVLDIAKAIFNRGLQWDEPGIVSNPVNKVKNLPVNNERERYLDHEEVKKLIHVLQTDAPRPTADIILFLLFTGTRRTEALTCCWPDIDLNNRVYTIRQSKSGKVRRVPLSDNAIQILKNVQRVAGTDYVFANPKTLKPYRHIQNQWNRIRSLANIEDCRLHDLRHTFASELAKKHSLYYVQTCLGHTSPMTTKRYAHLSPESQNDAVNDTYAGIKIHNREDEENIQAEFAA